MVSVCPSVLSYHPGRGSRQVGNNCLGESVGHGAVHGGTRVFFSKGTDGKVGKGVIKLPIFFLGRISPFLIGNVLFRLVSYNDSCWEFCASSKAQLGESGVANFFLVSGEMKSETSMWTLKIHGGKQPPRLHNAKGSYDVSFCVYICITLTVLWHSSQVSCSGFRDWPRESLSSVICPCLCRVRLIVVVPRSCPFWLVLDLVFVLVCWLDFIAFGFRPGAFHPNLGLLLLPSKAGPPPLG